MKDIDPGHSAGTGSPGIPASDGVAKERFLSKLRRTGNPSLACRASRLTRRQIDTLRGSDSVFSTGYDDAMRDAADLLEAEAWRRALHGVESPVLKAGLPVIDPATGEILVVRRYSDPLLVMLLRGCKPEKFQTRGGSAMPADPMIGIREIATDNDPPRSDPGHR